MNKIALIAAFAAAIPAYALAQSAPPPVSPTPSAATTTSTPDNPERGKFRAACGADIAKYCGGTGSSNVSTPELMKEQRGKVSACLITHTADLSANCKAAVIERDAASKAKKS